VSPLRKEGGQVSPNDLEYLQRIFDRVCVWCHIERPSKRADLLASYLMDEFRAGNREETALFEAAMWREASHFESQAAQAGGDRIDRSLH